ncbi:MAG: glycosyltransferase family 2 protein [Ramlibacter sp.]|nr:glycosyltransferase family 2 protein [Ramlibacter sp.]
MSCVLPCRNEARNLDIVLPLLCELLPTLASAWEVILVDDGSTDGTAAVMRDWAGLPGFRVIQLSRNFGKEAALTAGLEAAAGDVVVLMDADLQHPPALIAEMMAHWHKGADMVYAVRTNRDEEGIVKRVGARLFYTLLNHFHRFKVPEGGGDFRLMDRSAVNALLALPERNRFMKGLYAWIGFDAVAIPYQPDARAHGRSHFGLQRLVHLSLDGLTSFATWPLRIVTVVGGCMALAGLAYGAFLTLSYLLWGHPISGWTTIVVSLLCFLGVQMIFLGILGEYIARIFEEVKARPLYVVRRELGRGLAVHPVGRP